MLTVREDLPEGFMDCRAEDLHRILPGPTLVHLPGRQPHPLFAAILLHGNEDTGLKAVQAVLKRYQTQQLPRTLSLFIGNVAAARHRLRRLDHQPDYNRVWPGSDTHSLAEHAMMQEVVAQMRSRDVFASIDIHNNTGLNPHYACVNSLEQPFLHLARLFSRIVVYFRRPLGVQSMAFAGVCPAVTVECGKAGDPQSDTHAAEFLDACLHLARFPEHAVAPRDLDLFQTVATVRVPRARTFAFEDDDVDIRFEPDLDHMNFRELDVGTVWGHATRAEPRLLDVIDDEGRDVYAEYFEVEDGVLMLRKQAMPAMLTLDTRVIRQDCLCYLMRRLPA